MWIAIELPDDPDPVNSMYGTEWRVRETIQWIKDRRMMSDGEYILINNGSGALNEPVFGHRITDLKIIHPPPRNQVCD